MLFTGISLSKKRLVVLAIIAGLVLSAAAFLTTNQAHAAKLSGELHISGSNTVFPLSHALAKEFMKRNKNVKITVTGPGTNVGIQDLLAGKVPLAGASRPLKPEEKAQGLKAYVIAREALVIVVHPKNKVKGLTMEQVMNIYLGKITNWKDVGGADAPIMAYSRPPASGTFDYFNELFLKKQPQAPTVKMLETHGLNREAVVKNPNAIAYLAFAYVNKKVKPVALNGVVPNKKTIEKGQYPVIRPLFHVTKGEPTGLTKEFLKWVLSPAGQNVVKKEYLPAKKK
ncbi:MAG: phosphate ABC transporter substrate-binding protein [Candidatus Aquicultor sp.]|nr:phosphate ABC transporter substrate-binding protein [Candidatus Aquicultor sp.]